MSAKIWREAMVERKVTYTLEADGRFFIIENVPARVCEETGEEFFAPGTVEKLHALVRGNEPPKRLIETPVYEFAA